MEKPKTLAVSQLVDRIAEQYQLPKATTRKIIYSVFDEITEGLKRNERVFIKDFGIFKIAERKARVARNPRTGISLNVPAKKTVRFSPVKYLKNAVKNGK